MRIEYEHEKKPKTDAVVTFLIGNGFDLGLGLRTKYSDFIPIYLSRPSNTDVIAKLKEKVSQNSDFWGDAELAFGKLRFSTFGKESYSVVKECVTDFSDVLSEYLQNEERRFQVPADELKLAFCTLMCSYYQRLGEYPKRNELKRLKRFNRLKVNVINFNYTETIDKMLPPSGTMTLPEWGKVEVQINEVCHVHGALSVGTHGSLCRLNPNGRATHSAHGSSRSTAIPSTRANSLTRCRWSCLAMCTTRSSKPTTCRLPHSVRICNATHNSATGSIESSSITSNCSCTNWLALRLTRCPYSLARVIMSTPKDSTGNCRTLGSTRLLCRRTDQKTDWAQRTMSISATCGSSLSTPRIHNICMTSPDSTRG